MPVSSLTHLRKSPSWISLPSWGMLPVERAGSNQSRDLRTSSTVTTIPFSKYNSSRYCSVLSTSKDESLLADSPADWFRSISCWKSFWMPLDSFLAKTNHLSVFAKLYRLGPTAQNVRMSGPMWLPHPLGSSNPAILSCSGDMRCIHNRLPFLNKAHRCNYTAQDSFPYCIPYLRLLPCIYISTIFL